MNIMVNGEQKAFDEDSLCVAELLKRCKVEMPEMVSVQLNREFVDKAHYSSTNIKDGDEVDFLYFMGGGVK